MQEPSSLGDANDIKRIIVHSLLTDIKKMAGNIYKKIFLEKAGSLGVFKVKIM